VKEVQLEKQYDKITLKSALYTITGIHTMIEHNTASGTVTQKHYN